MPLLSSFLRLKFLEGGAIDADKNYFTKSNYHDQWEFMGGVEPLDTDTSRGGYSEGCTESGTTSAEISSANCLKNFMWKGNKVPGDQLGDHSISDM